MMDNASPAALERLKKLDLYSRLRHDGCRPDLAMEAIGWSRATYYRWRKRRANGSSRAEFNNLYQGELTVKAINQALAYFQHHYNHYRPHDGIDLETPMDYYQHLKQAA